MKCACGGAAIMCCELSSQRGEKSSAGAIMSADAFVAFAYGDLKQYGFFSPPLDSL